MGEMTQRYLEDFVVGQTFSSERLRINEERIKTFASEFDPQPFHLDEEAARDTVFRGLAASGWHTARSPCGYWSRATSNPPAASWAPASTSSAGHGPCDPGISYASRARCSRYGRRGRVQI